MARNFEGLGVGIEVDDGASNKKLGQLGESVQGLWTGLKKASSMVPQLGQTLSKGFGKIGAKGGRAFGTVSMAMGTMIDKASSPELDHAYSSMYAGFNKSFSALTAGMNVTEKEMKKARKTIGSVAFGMGEDMDQAAQNWVAFEKQSVNLEKVLGTKGLTDTIKTLTKVTSVYDIQGQQLSQVVGSLVHGFGFTEEAVGSLADKIVASGRVFNMGKEAIQGWPSILETLNNELADFGKNLEPDEIEALTLSIVQLGGGLKEALGLAPEASIELARTLTTTLLGERKEIMNMARGLGGEFGPIAKQLMETGGDVNKMMDMIGKGDVLVFMDELNRMYKENEKRGGQASIGLQRFVGNMTTALGPDVAFAMKGNWDKARESMAQIPDALKGSAGLFKGVAKEHWKTSITAGEAWDRMVQGMKARMYSLSQKDVGVWKKQMKGGFEDTFQSIKALSSDEGPLGELTRKLLLVQRVGLSGLLPSLGGIAPLLGGITSSAFPMLTALGSMGIRFADLGKMAASGGALWGVFQLLTIGPEKAWEKILSFKDGLFDLFNKLPKKTQKSLLAVRDQFFGFVDKIKSGEVFEKIGQFFDKIPFGKIFTKVSDTIVKVLSGLGSVLSKVDWQNVAKTVVELIGKGFKTVGGFFVALFTGGEGQAGLKTTEAMIAGGMGTALINAIGGLKDIALGALKGLWSSIFDADSISGVMKNLATVVGGGFTVLLVMSKGFRAKMASVFLGKEGLISRWGSKAATSIGTVNKKYDVGFKGLIKVIKVGGKGVGTALLGVSKQMRRADKAVSRHGLFGAMGMTGPMMKKGFAQAGRGIKSGLGKIGGGLKRGMGKVRGGITGIIGMGMFMGLFEAMDQVKIRMKNISNIMSDELIPDFAKTSMAGNQAFRGIGKTADAVFMGIPSMIGEALGISSQDFDNFYFDMVAGAEKAFAILNNGFSLVISEMGIRWDTFKNVLSAGWDFIKSAANVAFAWLKSAWVDVTTHLESGVDTFISAFEYAFMKIGQAIEIGMYKVQSTIVGIIKGIPAPLRTAGLTEFATGFDAQSKKMGGVQGITTRHEKEDEEHFRKVQERELDRERKRLVAATELAIANEAAAQKALGAVAADKEGDAKVEANRLKHVNRLAGDFAGIEDEAARSKKEAAEYEERGAKARKKAARAGQQAAEQEAADVKKGKGKGAKVGTPTAEERAAKSERMVVTNMMAVVKGQQAELIKHSEALKKAVNDMKASPIDAYLTVELDGAKVSKGLKKQELKTGTGRGNR